MNKDLQILTTNNIDVYGDIEYYTLKIKNYLEKIQTTVNELNVNKDNENKYLELIKQLKLETLNMGFKNITKIIDNQLFSEYSPTFYNELFAAIKENAHILKKYLESEVQINNKVIVADDSKIIREFIVKVFKDNFEILEAKDGTETLELIKEHDTVSLLFLDLNMPETSGFEVLEYLKNEKKFKDIPVCIITGDDTKDTVSKACLYPIIDVLTKPFNEKDLYRLLEKAKHIKENN